MCLGCIQASSASAATRSDDAFRQHVSLCSQDSIALELGLLKAACPPQAIQELSLSGECDVISLITGGRSQQRPNSDGAWAFFQRRRNAGGACNTAQQGKAGQASSMATMHSSRCMPGPGRKRAPLPTALLPVCHCVCCFQHCCLG